MTTLEKIYAFIEGLKPEDKSETFVLTLGKQDREQFGMPFSETYGHGYMRPNAEKPLSVLPMIYVGGVNFVATNIEDESAFLISRPYYFCNDDKCELI